MNTSKPTVIYVVVLCFYEHIQAVPAADFSFRIGLRRMTASWLVMRRPRARSTLAPRASLFRLSVFSDVGTKRWSCSGLFSRRSRPSL